MLRGAIRQWIDDPETAPDYMRTAMDKVLDELDGDMEAAKADARKTCPLITRRRTNDSAHPRIPGNILPQRQHAGPSPRVGNTLGPGVPFA